MKENLASNIRHLEINTEIKGVLTGHIVAINDEKEVLVQFPGNSAGPIAAKFTHAVLSRLKETPLENLSVLLAFEQNNPRRPVIIDILYANMDDAPSVLHEFNTDPLDEVRTNGKKLRFDAKEEIIFNCGKSSITLTRAGKIILRGAYLLNRSTGPNVIKGASIRIN